MGKAILEISDGTAINTIDLLSPRFGYLLCDWRPARPAMTYIQNKNWFSGVQVPANITKEPTVDSFTFNARHQNQDRLIEDEKKFARILKMASMYWVDRAVKNVFYIKARAKDETGIRWAPIFSTQFHDDSNPYAQPFAARKPASLSLVVPVTHGDWLDYPPGTGGLPMYDNVISVFPSALTKKSQGVHFINDESRIMLVNSFSHLGITHIFRGDDITNLFELPEGLVANYDLFLTGGASDYTYFGMEIEESGTFPSLHGWSGINFNITLPAASASPLDFTWEFYIETSPGVFAWTELEVEDGTASFTEGGTVLFNISEQTFGELAILGISGYWCRALPAVALTQVPEISIKHPAATVLPHFDVMLASDELHVITQPDDVNPPEATAQAELVFALVYQIAEQVVPGPSLFRVKLQNTGIYSLGIGTYEWRWRTPLEDATYYGQVVTVDSDSEGAVEINLIGTHTETGVIKRIDVDTYWELDPAWKAAPDFIVGDYNPRVGDPITFNAAKSYFDIGADTILTSTWFYGDGDFLETTSPTIPAPTHTYLTSGFKTVTLLLEFAGGKGIIVTKTNMVNVIHEVVAIFKAANRRGFPGFSPNFDASASISTSGTIVSYDWDFGDGTVGSGVKPIKTYDTPGVYTVSLTVTDNSPDTDDLIRRNYIYVDNQLLYPGDEGIYLKLGFQPHITSWITGTRAPNKMFLGARSLVTEDDYLLQTFLPVNNELSTAPSGVRFYGNPPYETIVKDNRSYTGYVFKKVWTVGAYTPEAGEESLFCSYLFNSLVYQRYAGSYRVFLRMSSSSYLANSDVFFSAGISDASWWGGAPDPVNALNRTRRVTDALDPEFVTTFDLGSITLGGDQGVTQSLDIYWQPFMTKSNQELYLFDIVLIPNDEWYTEISFPKFHFGYDQINEIGISSITPDGRLQAYITKGGVVEVVPITIPDLPLAMLGKDVRFSLLSAYYADPATWFGDKPPVMYSRFDYFFEVSQVSKVNRYLSSRGST